MLMASALLWLTTTAPGIGGRACPRDELVARWHGLRVIQHQGLGGPQPAWIAFCRGKRLVRRFDTKGGNIWGEARAIDLDADGRTELATWYSTGGFFHCCTIHVVFRTDARRGVVATTLFQGNGFEGGEWRRLGGYPRPVLLTSDDSSAYAFTGYAGSYIFPYVAEIGPRGFRLADRVMQVDRRGWGPAALRHGPADWAYLLRGGGKGDKQYGFSTLAEVDPPAKRLKDVRELIDLAIEANDGGYLETQRLAAEFHIKLYCFYEPRCDIPALVRQLEGRHRGYLKWFTWKLNETLKDSELLKLRRAPAGWH